MDALRSSGDGVRLSVHVQPRAKTTAWSGPHGDVVRVRVAAPPIGGKANKALIAFVAETFGVGKEAVEIVRGEKNRRKVLSVAGVSLEEARVLLAERMEVQ